MANDEDEEALFNRLEKGLTAMRRDAELVRAGGVGDVSTGLARIEAALHGLVAALEFLRTGADQQQAGIARIEAAVASADHDRRQLRQTVEELASGLHDQAAPEIAIPPQPATEPIARPARTRIGMVVLILVLMVSSGTAGWVLADRKHDLMAAMQHWQAELSAQTGIDFGRLHAPAEPARVVAQAEPPKAPPPQPPASTTNVSPPAAPAPQLPVASAAATSSPAPKAATPSAAAAVPPSTTGIESSAATRSSPTAPIRAALPAGTVAGSGSSSDGADGTASQSPALPEPQQHASSSGVANATAVSPSETQGTSVPSTAHGVNVESPPPRVQPAANPAILPLATPTSSGSAPPATGNQIVLRAISGTWVRVHQMHGATLLNRTLTTGETWQVPADPNLLLDTGNASGLVLEIDGEPTRLVRKNGDVIRGILLDSDLKASGAVQAIRENDAPKTAPRPATSR